MKASNLKRLFASSLLAIALLALPEIAQANMSYTPWIHSMIQNGPEMEITVSIFEETDATNNEGEPFPGLGDEYTLGFMSPEESYTLFKNRTLDPEEAYEVTGKVCHDLYYAYYPTNAGESCEDSSTCVDGFCAVAYRYKVIDHCPPFESDFRYWMTVSSGFDLYYEGEGLGMSNWYEVVEEVGDQCPDVESGCSVSHAGHDDKALNLFQILLKLI